MLAQVKTDFDVWGEYKRTPDDDYFQLGGSGQTIEYSIMQSKPPRRTKPKPGDKPPVNAYSKKYYCSTCGAPLNKLTCETHGFDRQAKTLTFQPACPKPPKRKTPRRNSEPAPAARRIERVMTALADNKETFHLYQVGVNKHWMEYTNQEGADDMGISVALYRQWTDKLYSVVFGMLYQMPVAVTGELGQVG